VTARDVRLACLACAACVATMPAGATAQSLPGAQVRSDAGARGPDARRALGALARAGGMPGPPALATTDAGATPPVEPARVAGEVLAGAYAGIAGYFVGSWTGSALGRLLPTASDGTRHQIAFGAGIVGATLATAASVSVVGNIGDQTGSYPAALAGTVGGVAAGLLLNQLLYGHARLPSEHGSSRVRWIEASLEALLPSVGATIAFTSTRRYK
jgi:hypothetical protein